MSLAVVEIVVKSESDFEEIRRWAAMNTRGGDGLVIEQGRLFVVLPDVSDAEVEHAIKRLDQDLSRLGGLLRVCGSGTDEVADSVRRRAEAQILPVQSRQEIV